MRGGGGGAGGRCWPQHLNCVRNRAKRELDFANVLNGRRGSVSRESCVCFLFFFWSTESKCFFSLSSKWLRTCYVAETFLQLLVLLPQHSKRWDYSCAPPCPPRVGIFKNSNLQKTEGTLDPDEKLLYCGQKWSSK